MRKILVSAAISLAGLIGSHVHASNIFDKLKIPKPGDIGISGFVPDSYYEDRWNSIYERHTLAQNEMFQAVMNNPMARMVRGFYSSIANEISTDEAVIKKANENKWTYNKCVRIGLTAFGAAIAIKGAVLCAELTEGEPISSGVCIAAIGAASGAIVETVCTQLCQDRHLQDCK